MCRLLDSSYLRSAARAKYIEQLMVNHSVKAVLLILAIFTTSVTAETSTPKIWGYGTKTCTSYIETYRSWEQGKQEQVWEYFRYRDWLTGFITALSLVTDADVMRGVKPKNAMRRINLHCEENLGQDFFTASSEFIRILGSGSRPGSEGDGPGQN